MTATEHPTSIPINRVNRTLDAADRLGFNFDEEQRHMLTLCILAAEADEAERESIIKEYKALVVSRRLAAT